MRKLILLLILIFPTLSLGQSYAGNYRAMFFNFFTDPRTIIAEFEVGIDNTISGQVKFGNDITLFKGSVDKKGKFEAVSQAIGNTVYKLKGKFDKDRKISFIQRVEQRSPGSKSVSENGLEGTFAKVEKAVAQPENSIAQKESGPADTGQSRLVVQHSNPLFGNEWAGFSAKLTIEKDAQGTIRKLEILDKNEESERRLSISIRPSLATEVYWKLNGFDIGYASYKEQNKKTAGRNVFSSTYDTYRNVANIQDGTIVIVRETDSQAVFKLTQFRIKRLGKDDFVELNGFIYADK